MGSVRMTLGRGSAGLMDESRVLTRMIDRIAFASDASLYRLIPRAVVQPMNSEEVRKTLPVQPRAKDPVDVSRRWNESLRAGDYGRHPGGHWPPLA